MADEIRGSVALNVTNGSFLFNKNISFNFDQAAIGGGNPGTVDVGTSEEVIALGDITTEGWCIIQNLDTTNYVDWGPTSGGSMVQVGRLEAGEFACLRLYPGLTLRMQANTSACKVEINVFED